MGGGDATHDRQAESAAAAGAAAPDERLLYTLQFVLGNAPPAVGDDELHNLVTESRSQIDVRGAGVTHGVVDQVVQREDDGCAVAADRGQRDRYRHRRVDPAIAKELAEAVHHFLDHLLRLDRFEGIDVGDLGDARVSEQV